jgi:hypothetical protein
MRGTLARALRSSRLLLASTGVALALSLPVSATASHSSYWFFQGNLPTGGGTATVHHEAICCYTFMVVRMNWEAATHDMNFLFIHHNGSWHGLLAEYWDADQEAIVNTDTYARGGCQNPPSWTWYVVWTNCHIRGQ